MTRANDCNTQHTDTHTHTHRSGQTRTYRRNLADLPNSTSSENGFVKVSQPRNHNKYNSHDAS